MNNTLHKVIKKMNTEGSSLSRHITELLKPTPGSQEDSSESQSEED